MITVDKELIFNICDKLNDQLTVLKGFIQLNKMNNKIDHSIYILKEIDNLEKSTKDLINQLMECE